MNHFKSFIKQFLLLQAVVSLYFDGHILLTRSNVAPTSLLSLIKVLEKH